MASSATRDTGTKRTGSASVKVIADTTLECTYVQSVNVGDTNTYTLVAYVYTSGAAVTTADLDLWYNGAEVATTFASDSPAGWYKLSGTLTGANAARDYGVRVHANKTVYVDDMALTGPAPATITYLLNSGTGGVASLDVESSVTASNFVSDVAVGTSPYATTSTTVNTNLNADLLDGYHVGTSAATIPLLNGANTWSGVQTVEANLIVNEAGSATVDLRAESDTEANMLFLDASADKLYLGGSAAGSSLIVDKGGGASFPYIAKTADFTLTDANYTVDWTANSCNATLPTAVGRAGKIFQILNSGTGLVTMLTTSSQTIQGDASGVIKLSSGENLTVQSDNANWKVIH